MNALFNASLFILAQDRIEAINIAFRERKTEDSSKGTIMLVAIVVAILAAAVVLYLMKKRAERVVADPRALFKELCKTHHLSRKHRRLLRFMSREKKLANPCELLFNAELWTLDANQEQSLCVPKVRTEIQKLRALLYVPAKLIEA